MIISARWILELSSDYICIYFGSCLCRHWRKVRQPTDLLFWSRDAAEPKSDYLDQIQIIISPLWTLDIKSTSFHLPVFFPWCFSNHISAYGSQNLPRRLHFGWFGLFVLVLNMLLFLMLNSKCWSVTWTCQHLSNVVLRFSDIVVFRCNLGKH